MTAASTQVEKGKFRSLLVQAAVPAGFLLRLEHRATNGRITTRIVQPVAYQSTAPLERLRLTASRSGPE